LGKTIDYKKFKNKMLEVYSRVNPSEINIIEEQKNFEYLESAYNDLFQKKLKLHTKIFRNSTVLDIGCGTGETDLFLAMYGAEVHGIDPNEYSIKRAKKIAKLFKMEKHLKFYKGDFLELPFFNNRKFDFIFSQGVLHHVGQPEKALRNVLKYLKPGGCLILAFGELSALYQRYFQRLILNYLAGQDEDKKVHLARELFHTHLSRAKKFGRRSEESIIYDSYIIPRPRTVDITKLFRFLEKQGMTYYSSWPPVDAPFRCDSYIRPLADFDRNTRDTILSLFKLRWMFTQDEDSKTFADILSIYAPLARAIEKVLGDFDRLTDEQFYGGKIRESDLNEFQDSLRKLEKKFKNAIDTSFPAIYDLFKSKIEASNYILDKIKSGKLTPEDIDGADLMKGHCGVGLNWVVFKKKEQ